ncbi:glycerophosphoryl diester phosphodiesterase, partial [human gut metagenome]
PFNIILFLFLSGFPAMSAPTPRAYPALASPSPVPGGARTVFAHRGASALAPENTLAAFRRAAAEGAAWI